MRRETNSCERSSGSIYEELGLKNARELDAKWQLAYWIRTISEERGYTQEEAARVLGADQADVSRLMDCQTRKIRFDRLFRYLGSLDPTFTRS